MSRADTLALNDQKVHDLVLRGTPPRFDSSVALATTESVRLLGKQYSGSTAFNGNGTILAALVGQAFVLFGDAASTIDLPNSAALPRGSTVTIICYNVVSAAITRAGTDLLYGADPGQSVSVKNIKMLYGDVLELTLLDNTPGAGAWYVTGGNIFASVVTSLFDSSQRIASTKVLRKALGSFSGAAAPSGPTTLTASDIGKIFTFGGAGSYIVNLPLASSVVDGASMLIKNISISEITLSRQGADSLVMGNKSDVSMLLGVGDFVVATASGVNWVCTGSATLKNTGAFAALLEGSGYRKLPSGEVEQWGTALIPGSTTSIEVTLPIAFPKYVLHALSSDSGATCYPTGVQIKDGDLSRIIVYVAPYNVSNGSITAKSAIAAVRWKVTGR